MFEERIEREVAKVSGLLPVEWADGLRKAMTEMVEEAQESGMVSTTTSRMYLIAQLEGHYGRYLRHAIITNADLAYVKERGKPIPIEAWVGTFEQLIKLATEGAEALEAARQCPDEALPDLIRWQTNPNWREAMRAVGMEFNTNTMRWQGGGINE